MLEGEPALDPQAVTDLLSDHAYTVTVEDPDTGVESDETRWDLYGAASEGWLLKASKVSGDYQIGIDSGQALYRQQVHQHCLEQSVRFAARAKIRPQTVSRTDVAY